MHSHLYREVIVWKRVSEKEITRYCCFERLPEGGYGVQSIDWYHLPLNEKNSKSLDNNFLGLMVEDTLINQTKLYTTVVEAIAAFEKNFGNEKLEEQEESNTQ
jgi:hypothetical protein